MGADLLMSYVEIAETREQAQARLDKLQIVESDLSRLEDCGYFGFENEEFSPEIQKVIKARLQQALDLVYDSYENYSRRDIAKFTIDGNRTFLFTGGMTYGDDPTDSYPDINLFFEFLGYPSHVSPDSEVVRQWKESVGK